MVLSTAHEKMLEKLKDPGKYERQIGSSIRSTLEGLRKADQEASQKHSKPTGPLAIEQIDVSVGRVQENIRNMADAANGYRAICDKAQTLADVVKAADEKNQKFLQYNERIQENDKLRAENNALKGTVQDLEKQLFGMQVRMEEQKNTFEVVKREQLEADKREVLEKQLKASLDSIKQSLDNMAKKD
jgi:hypothetical protein